MHEEFKVHLLNPQGIEKAQHLAKLFDDPLTILEPLMPVSSRYTSLVRTHLETASFFAKKAMACIPDNQVNGGVPVPEWAHGPCEPGPGGKS